MTLDVAQTNQATWFATDVAEEYAREHEPFPAEASILGYLAAELRDARLLDIGVGAGRTTAFLPAACREYIGVDYSRAMLEIATRHFPETDLREQDARDLSTFSDGSFDVVWFSYNGIDYVSHADSLKILGEIRRVLRPRGLFVFSTHNRDTPVIPAYHWENLELTLNPLRCARRIANYLLGIAHSVRLGPKQIRTEEYAILNDQGHGYSLLTYYISRHHQIEQLRASGFDIDTVWGMNGERLGNDAEHDGGYSLHYVARTSAPTAS